MTFDLLNQLGLSGLDYSYLFIGLACISLILLILVIIQMFQIGSLKKKYKKFMGGKDVKSLENKLEMIVEDNKYIIDLSNENKKNIREIKKEMESSFNKIGIVKYDAFNQMGGQLSFCLALLDENNNGFIMNSVHSTEGCYCYTKEIKNGESVIDLGKEEAKALAIAVGKE